MTAPPAPVPPIRPGRAIQGFSAVLLPYRDGAVDWPDFEAHLVRTAAAGLVPAVNMDTGFVALLDDPTRTDVLARAGALGVRFVGGVHVRDAPGSPLDLDAYRRGAQAIASAGGLPIVFPSYGLTGAGGDAWVAAHADLARDLDELLAFELSPAFSPAGAIFGIEDFEALLAIPQVVGAKHSSLQRLPEWERLARRDATRADFLVLTGNDLATDMVCWGSDYLLGLSSFAPEAFAARDRCWETRDPAFYELNDVLQYLGQFAFRPPVPAYKHSCAQFLMLRERIAADETPPGALRRPDTDLAVLEPIARRLDELGV